MAPCHCFSSLPSCPAHVPHCYIPNVLLVQSSSILVHTSTPWGPWNGSPDCRVHLMHFFPGGHSDVELHYGIWKFGKGLWGCSSCSHQVFSGCCVGPGLPLLWSRKGGHSISPTTTLLFALSLLLQGLSYGTFSSSFAPSFFFFVSEPVPHLIDLVWSWIHGVGLVVSSTSIMDRFVAKQTITVVIIWSHWSVSFCAVDSMVLAAAPLNLCHLLPWLAGGHIICSKRNMNACAKFHGKPPNSC